MLSKRGLNDKVGMEKREKRAIWFILMLTGGVFQDETALVYLLPELQQWEMNLW